MADSTWHVRRFAQRSFEDEFAGTLQGDLFMLQIALVAIVIYTYLAISNWRDGIVGSRLLLTAGGALELVYLTWNTAHDASGLERD